MSSTSYVNALTSTLTSYTPTDSVLVSSDLPDRFYLRGITASMGRTNAGSPYALELLTFQDGPGQGNSDGIIRFTIGQSYAGLNVECCSFLFPDDSYVLIDSGLYFWTDSTPSATYPLEMTVFYT